MIEGCVWGWVEQWVDESEWRKGTGVYQAECGVLSERLREGVGVEG